MVTMSYYLFCILLFTWIIMSYTYVRPLHGYFKRPLHAVEDINVEEKPVVKKEVRVTWKAEKFSSVKVKETLRTCEEYMALPATEYSVLSANQIVRLSDTSFKAILPTLNFFGTKITPIIYVDVIVYPELAKSEIIVVKAETIGSEVADMINGTFNISAVNTVFSSSVIKESRNGIEVIKKLNSNTTLQIDVIVPENTKVKIPSNIIQSSGSFIIQSSLNIIVPTFVRILAADFKRWSSGVSDRNAVDGATLS